MLTKEKVDQQTFDEQFFWNQPPNFENHCFIKLEKMIDWPELYSKFNSFYKPRGRNSVPLKHMILLLLIKHLENLSDEEVVARLSSDLAMQKALNLPFHECQLRILTSNTSRDGKIKKITGYINPSALTAFRKRLGSDGAKLLEELLYKNKEFKKQMKGRRVVIDTTVIPADILYPTDIGLLEQARQFLIKLLSQSCKRNIRTYKRVARKTFISYIKLKNKLRNKTKKIHKQMINYVKRNFKQVNHLINSESLSKKKKQILKNIAILLAQQIELYKKIPRNGKKQGINIKDRIVSIFKGHVRPIPRGKIPQRTEFGSKILLEKRNNFVFPIFITNDNIADSVMCKGLLHNWKGMSLGADRGFHSKINTAMAWDAGINHYYVEKKGKIGLKKTAALKKMRSLRAILEAKIGLNKRKYGGNRNRYNRGTEGDDQWIIFSFLGMNIDKLFQM